MITKPITQQKEKKTHQKI